jgi:hypothetical protein
VPNPPKIDPVRGSRGRGLTMLPAGGRKGTPPPWPIPGIMTDDERLLWEQLWSSPQAVAWEGMGVATCREVARYCRLLIDAERPDAKAAAHAQATASADRLGLTPKAMRLLLWQIAPDEVAEKRETSTGAGARGRIRAVG